MLSSTDISHCLDALSNDILLCSTNQDVDDCLQSFQTIVDKVASPLFKKAVRKRTENDSNGSFQNNNIWYNNECCEKKDVFLNLLNGYRSDPNDVNRINMVQARSIYKNTLRKCRYNFDKEKTSKLVNARFKNARLYWNMLKESAGVKNANIPLSSFEMYFKSINNPEDRFFTPDDVLNFIERYEHNEFKVMFAELNEHISFDEIYRAIKQLKTNKSGGPDYLLNEFFIAGGNVFIPVLHKLFNRLFDIGYFPESWSEGYIIPLHKKGNVNNVDNYRGVTLLSCLGKLFTHILNNRLRNWAEEYNVYVEAQAGFRAHMSTIDNVFVLHGLINHMLNQGKQLYALFVDFSKAFDYVVRENLCGGSLTTAQSTLSGQAQKAIFKLNKYLYKFTYITPKHKLDLFDKLVAPILNYGSEVCGFAKDLSIERLNKGYMISSDTIGTRD
ncbi:uncharacterized protein LOC128550031 [Mercenaria mercenaria]|uniref:uncharacterized protein LOC128550031 n=1 Tax=Mercenaria mercenaria TaxID=6596 RepID=UPI00234ECB67|nr:uncharacterized protein LOC128550031 [Mercenaria mercenaria]